MKVVIFGKNGQLGKELTAQCTESNIEFIGADLPETDITNSDQVAEFLSVPDISVVINAAAYTNVDMAEDEPEISFAVNADGPGNIAKWCNDKNIPLIHVSTDYVFDGSLDRPYVPEDQVSPLGIYGQSKEKGEMMVRRFQKHLIIRTSWLYSVHGHNFVKTILRLAKEREVLNIVSDQFGCPTCAQDFAGDILKIVDRLRSIPNAPFSGMPWGTYHYCGSGIVSWFDFAKKIVEYAKQYEDYAVKTINPIKTSEYPVRAARPFYSALDCSKLDMTFDISRKIWTDSLEITLKRLLSRK